MTKQELSQHYYLSNEIKRDEERLAQLEMEARSIQSSLQGLRRGSGLSDKVGRIAAEIADIEAIINLNIQKRWREQRRITRYINSIEDSLMRQILTLRYVDNLSWNRVAQAIGGNNTADSIRMLHNRFLGGD